MAAVIISNTAAFASLMTFVVVATLVYAAATRMGWLGPENHAPAAASPAAYPSTDAAAGLLVRSAAVELRHAAGALEQAAQFLKAEHKGFRASHAYQAAQRAKAAAEELTGG